MVYTDRQRLTADYLEELVEFGKSIGLALEEIQDLNTLNRHTHFLLTAHLLERAIKRGAITVSREQIVLYMYRMRRMGERELFPADDLPADLPVMNGRTGQTELI
jgi:hypothetical protein